MLIWTIHSFSMAPSNPFSNVIRTLFPFADFVYILQLEEYSVSRYIHWLRRFFFCRGIQQRQRLVMTARACILVGFSWLIFLAVLVVFYFAVPHTSPIALATCCLLLIPVWVGIAASVTSPFFALVKRERLKKAADKVKKMKTLKVVAIAGSYGKSTTKQLIYDMVRYHHRTQMIGGNINTPLGIAEWVLAKLEPQTEILIVEMDTYAVGEIAASASVTPPDVAVITSVGDQHLERFDDERELCLALTEIYTPPHKKPRCIACIDTWLTLKEVAINLAIEDGQKYELDIGTHAAYQHELVSLAHLTTALRINMIYALKVAELLDIPVRFVQHVLLHPHILDRRKTEKMMYGYEALDDSYNISLTTAYVSIDTARKLADDKRKKLLVVTAGIPELSVARLDSHQKLGEYLRTRAAHTYILESVFGGAIAQGIVDTEKYTITPNLQTFAAAAPLRHATADYLLLVLPELTDLYY